MSQKSRILRRVIRHLGYVGPFLSVAVFEPMEDLIFERILLVQWSPLLSLRGVTGCYETRYEHATQDDGTMRSIDTPHTIRRQPARALGWSRLMMVSTSHVDSTQTLRVPYDFYV